VRGWGKYLRRGIYPVVLAVIATFAYFSAGQSSVAGGSSPQPFSLGRVARILVQVPDLWAGAVGRWGLGWLDTSMPALVWVAAFGILAATIYSALWGADLRRGLAVGAVGLALWVVPAYVQYLSGADVGTDVQPRYILPLLTLLAVIALARVDGMAFRLGVGQRWIMVGALSAANAVALYYNMRRYLTGTDVHSLSLDALREWWWRMPVPPDAVWIGGTLAFGLGLVLLTRELTLVSPAGRASVGGGAPAAVGASDDVPRVDLALADGTVHGSET